MLNTQMFSTMLALSLMLFSATGEAHSRSGRFSHHHSHPRFGFYFGAPWYPRPYYPYYPYYNSYYFPEIVTVPRDPPIYIERGAPPSSQRLPAGYWYYCTDPDGYYPYVKECPSGWRQVDPAPASPN